jgi:hypothetical protein
LGQESATLSPFSIPAAARPLAILQAKAFSWAKVNFLSPQIIAVF